MVAFIVMFEVHVVPHQDLPELYTVYGIVHTSKSNCIYGIGSNNAPGVYLCRFVQSYDD